MAEAVSFYGIGTPFLSIEEIMQKLCAIEIENNVRLLYAVESGSIG
jgi:hypothetical protein